MPKFDFKELVARAHFDYVGPAFPEWWANNKRNFLLPGLKRINQSNINGKKFFMELKLSFEGQEFSFPNEPLVSLSLSKTIVETATAGKYRKGTVKEYINTEDWQITIRGVCVNTEDSDEYPTEDVQMLNRMFEVNEALEVVSNPFFELFGIRKLVLKDYELDDMVGESGAQRYAISAVSDQDFYADLEERERQNLLS